jgi:imidazolonepropionase-like amidohydrolase
VAVKLGFSIGWGKYSASHLWQIIFYLLFLAGVETRLVAEPGVLAITNVGVIDARGAPAQPASTVVISGKRITQVGKSADIIPPADARIIDGTGKFLIPGLWDMHVHWEDKDYLPLFIANGVTGVRMMWGFPMHHEWRKQIEAGLLVGPRLFIASALVDGPKPIWPGSTVAATPEEGRQAVIEARKTGADFVKVYSMLPREVYFAIADEAKKQGIPFEGHTPIAVSAAEVSDAGQKSIEHLTELLVACSTREAELLKQAQDYLVERQTKTNAAHIISHMLDADKVELETYDSGKAEALFAKFKKNHTWQCPTLTVLHNIACLNDPVPREDPRLKYMPVDLREFWIPTNDFRFKGVTSNAIALEKKMFQKDLELIGALQRAGVDILAGTDVSNPFCYPGFSLHDELAYLVQAGLTPMQALQAATLNAAHFMGRGKDVGTVEKGRIADLVLLEANPLDDIHNTTKINAVVFGGRLFTRHELDSMLSDAATLAATSKPSISEALFPLLPAQDAAAVIKRYQELKASKPDAYDFSEKQLNEVGYYLLSQKRAREAIQILKLNAAIFPKSGNAYDSLGEAYLAAGETNRSIENYQKSLQLDPDNDGARKKLKELNAR